VIIDACVRNPYASYCHNGPQAWEITISMSQRDNVSHILDKLGSEGGHEGNTIPVERLREWMHRPEIEVQAAIYDLVTSSERVKKVVPDLTFEDYLAFMPAFFSRCIIENPSTDLTLSRWEAAMEFLGWFGNLWDDPSVERSVLAEAKDQVRKLYLEGNSDVRLALIQGTLEHLFENASVRDFFADWLKEPTLQKAYEEAAEWSTLGGHHTPYGPKRIRD
jgi:hypothetical protein